MKKILALATLLCAIATPVHAALFKQGFDLTVERLGYQPNGYPPQMGFIDLPKVGTKGVGSFTYDTNDIQYVNSASYPVGYYLGTPGNIAFKDFSIDFYGHHYTQREYPGGRIGEIFLFDLDSSGQYKPENMVLNAVDSNSLLYTIGHTFTYSPNPTAHSALGFANGKIEYTNSTPVPEPSVVPGAIIFMLGVIVFHRKREPDRRSG